MQLDFFAEQGGSSGKTSLEHSAATKEEILLSWLVRWQDATSMSPKMAGERKAWRWATTGLSNGACLTRNGSEWRNGAAACSLSSMLETGQIAPQFFLSAMACAGILRRAGSRGKKLPHVLARALREVADSEQILTSTAA